MATARPQLKWENTEIIANLFKLDMKSLREALDEDLLNKLNQKEKSKRVRSRSDPDSVLKIHTKSKSDPHAMLKNEERHRK
jgi:hypothetical protein